MRKRCQATRLQDPYHLSAPGDSYEMASSSIVCATPLSASAALTANASRVQSGAAAGPSVVAALPLGGSRSTQKLGGAAGLRSSSFVAENVGARFEAVSRGVVARSAGRSAVTTCKVGSWGVGDIW